jgi:hypothetical protein
MDTSGIEAALEAAEASVAGGGGVGGTGFWPAVNAVKRDPALVETHADRIARIDRAAFERWALLTVPVAIGTAIMVVGTLVGLGLVWLAYEADRPWNGLLLLVGTGATMTTTHGLAHLAAGWSSGMRFTHWFIGTIGRPQPGVKVDYATYLRTPARRRAWMHAAGAVMTKLVPFFALPPALVMDAPGWTVAILVVVGIGTIVTDVLWSTKSSDWKKFRREMGFSETA